MIGRIISGLILACILIPTFFWAVDYFGSSVKPENFGKMLYDAANKASKVVRDLAAESIRKSVIAQQDKVSAEVEEIELRLASSGNLKLTESARVEIQNLLERMKAHKKALAKQLVEMDQARLESERYALLSIQAKALKTEWNCRIRIVTIESSLAEQASIEERESAAAAFNDFFESIVSKNFEAARKISSVDFQSKLNLKRLTSMSRNIPKELELGFVLRQSKEPNKLEAWVGESRIATLASLDGKFVVEDAWN